MKWLKIIFFLIVTVALAAPAPLALPAPYPLQYWVTGNLLLPAENQGLDLSDYKVILYKQAGDPSQGYAFKNTDANGRFEINPYDDWRFDPKPAEYKIGVVSKNGYGVSETNITLNEQGFTEVAPPLQLAINQGIGDPDGGSAKVTVVNAQGAIIANATVTLATIGLVGEFVAADNVYVVKNIPLGTFTVTASAQNYGPNTAQVTILNPGDEKVLQIQLLPLGKGGTISGKITDLAQNALKGAVVTVGDISSNPTDSDGLYTIALPLGNNLSAKASLDGYGDKTFANLNLTPQQPNLVQDFVLELLPGTQVGTFKGKVVRAAGEVPIVGAIVSDGTRSQLTNANGNFTIGNVPVGFYSISANADGYVPKTADNQEITNGNTTIVPTFKLLVLGLNEAVIYGIVKDKKGPLPLATVTITIGGNDIIVNPNAAGTYIQVVPVFDPNTEVAVTASLDNYVQKTENLTISEGDNQEVNFLLESLFDNAGVVSLTIARSADEKNIEVTWDDAATPQPQIFMRKGDGSGSYLNSDPVINWTKVAEDGALLQGIDPLEFAYANGKLTHLGQVGAGSQGEVYYKALVKGKNPGDIPQGSLTTCFENAQAVGKFNINLEIGKDMIISTPLLPQNNDRKFSTIFGNQLDGSGATIFGYIDGYKPAYKDGGNWLGALAPLGFDEKRGYWIVGVKAQTILTLVGLVANTPTININLSLLGDNLVGHPYPNPITFDNSGLAQILAEDKSVVWGFIDGYKPATLNAGGVWGGSLVGLKLNPGQGYWILIKSKNDQNDKDNVDWQYPCQ